MIQSNFTLVANIGKFLHLKPNDDLNTDIGLICLFIYHW